MNLSDSETKINLLRAFAGESQARNRYEFAAGAAKKDKLPCIQQVFLYTAGQEKEHAEIFFNHLKKAGQANVNLGGADYPVDLQDDVLTLLKNAHHNEYEEYESAYPAFAKKAKEEGFSAVAQSFEQIAGIEKTHGDRFALFADLLERKSLFVSDVKTGWICLNCGYVFEGTQAPQVCPVCSHEQGYFVRLELSPWYPGNFKKG